MRISERKHAKRFMYCLITGASADTTARANSVGLGAQSQGKLQRYYHLPMISGKVMISVLSICSQGGPCTESLSSPCHSYFVHAHRTCSNLFNLDLAVQWPPRPPDMFKLVRYEQQTFGKQAVLIRLKCPVRSLHQHNLSSVFLRIRVHLYWSESKWIFSLVLLSLQYKYTDWKERNRLEVLSLSLSLQYKWTLKDNIFQYHSCIKISHFFHGIMSMAYS